MEEQIISNPRKLAIIGGGLVGSLAACYFGQRGYEVNLYEYRKDIRKCELVQGRSINLALSVRGREALKGVNLEKMLTQYGIPMYGRMIHNVDGSTRSIAYDPVYKRVCFRPNGVLVDADADLIIGADGAFSTVRNQMIKREMVDYSQAYVKHGYMELCIPPENNHKMAPNHLHIWPRGGFMMIALPNQDKSWTVTLFMPHEEFERLFTEKAIIHFFNYYFADAVDIVGEQFLIQTILKSKPSSLLSVKCSPYHVGSKAVIIGDAAHAMVPFFGQGMNAGFEDVRLLDDILHNHSYSIDRALNVFSTTRIPNAEAISDLAMYNYTEMRDLVNKRSFILRKYLDNFLYRLAPGFWVPLYQSVTFTNMDYKKCVENRKWQDSLLRTSSYCLGLFTTVTVLVVLSIVDLKVLLHNFIPEYEEL